VTINNGLIIIMEYNAYLIQLQKIIRVVCSIKLLCVKPVTNRREPFCTNLLFQLYSFQNECINIAISREHKERLTRSREKLYRINRLKFFAKYGKMKYFRKRQKKYPLLLDIVGVARQIKFLEAIC
jgi:hypothetical protein